MSFRTIAAILQSEGEFPRVLDCAVPLAGRLEAHLVGIHAEVIPVPYSTAAGFPGADFIQVSAELNKETTGKLRSAFHARAEEAALSFEWRTLDSFSGDGKLAALPDVRASDLIVAAQHDMEGGEGTDIGNLVYEAGRPVLMVPHSGPILSSFRRVLLAWNGSREAARAAFDALPFLVEAAQTDILVIDPLVSLDTTPDAAGSRIAACLGRHGVSVGVSVRNSHGQSVGDLIQERIAASGADLLVLGASSHSWLHELLFAGVTRSLLRSAPVSVFLSC